ncbi:MAG: MBOAT family protein [Cryomorphaceae bacterium]|nr:MBOAT family protein [Cryomorphaceae bacterium]
MEVVNYILGKLFTHSGESPLIFTQVYFWYFYAAVLFFFALLYPRMRLRNAYLFFISLYFYYQTSGFFFLILIFSTLVDFFIGKQIFRAKTDVGKKWWVAFSITVNLLVLGYFKYAYFFTENFNALFSTNIEVYNHFALWSNGFFGSEFRVDRILLPVGISFFTFQTISYSIDIYRGLIKPVRSIFDFGFYVSFFPQLVAGPIVRASDFIPQLYKPYQLNKLDFGMALFWILNGLLKKMVLADYIAVNFIDRVFANPLSYSGFENVLALYGYSLQVYADFSGYTDIAIGLALLLGFHLPLNFNSPYKANNVGGFWKRWHISLSSWLKDYLYIPMGGNRKGSLFSYIMVGVIVFFISILSGALWVPMLAIGVIIIFTILALNFPKAKKQIDTNINLMLTMTIGGLWHGASWSMVIWGALNGIGLVIYKWVKNILPWRNKEKWYNHAIGVFITLNFITFTRVWFRGENWEKSNFMLNQIAYKFQWENAWAVMTEFSNVFLLMLAGYIIHWLPATWKIQYRHTFVRLPLPGKIVVGFVVFLVIYQVMSAELQPFIYFAF